MKSLIQTLFFILLVTQVCFGQWMQLYPNIPGGVVKTVMVLNDTIVVGLHPLDHSEMNVYSSTNSGASWQALGLDNVPVWSLAKCGPYLLVGTFYSGIYRSSDWGATWENKVPGVIIYSMEVDGSTVYAGTNGEGVLISTDQGDTWNSLGPPNTWVSGGIAITDQYVFALAQTSGHLNRKSKSSPIWTPISSPADTIHPYLNEIFAHGSSVFIPTYQGLFVSRNYGSTWSKSDSGLPPYIVVGYLSSIGDSILCIASGDLYLSTDIGESWQILVSTPYTNISTKLAANNELQVLGTQGSGVYVSKDFGETWNERGVIKGHISSLLSRGNILLLGSGTGGIYYSSDNGENWSPSKSGMGSASITGLSSNESTIFASAEFESSFDIGGLYLSNDEAITWTRVINGYSVRMVQAIDNLVFANAGWGDIGGWHYFLDFSIDGGNNWTTLDSLGSLSKFASNDSLLFAGSGLYSNSGWGYGISPPWGVYISRDLGYTWESTTFPEQQVTSLAVRGNFVAVTSTLTDTTNISYNHFHLSNDNGESWTTINNGIMGKGLDLIWLVDGLVASTSEGIFYLKSGSNTWTLRNEGLNDSIVGNLTVHNNELFLIGSSRTVWHRPLSEITSISEEQINEAPTVFLLSQNYPNPFNPSTKIKYSIPQSSQVVVKVYDILGNEIETLVNEEKLTGTYELNWNAANLPSGVYFYQLKAGSFVETKKMVLMK